MNTQIIFETQRLIVRKLLLSDLEPFHEMQSNINVLQYVRVKAMTFEENTKELAELIESMLILRMIFGFMQLKEN
tara:strand:- start:627 stop:851 length:225 start_codon:yes stop_codon:yes gene_type:complete